MDLPEIVVVSTSSIDGKARGYKKTQRLSQIYPLSKKVLEEIHTLRSRADAIMVGANTVRLDNPYLTVRYAKVKKKPYRVTISKNCNFDPSSNIFNTDASTIVITSKNSNKEIVKVLKKKGINVIKCGTTTVDIKKALLLLKRKGINKILVEGGPNLLSGLFNLNLIQKLVLITYPIIIGKNKPLLLFNEKIKRLIKTRMIKSFVVNEFVIRFYKILS